LWEDFSQKKPGNQVTPKLVWVHFQKWACPKKDANRVVVKRFKKAMRAS
jgi:hypothetical protein